MEKTLTNFIRSLRNAEIRISTAETLDALSAVELVGYKDKEFLKDSLSIVLPKTPDEKETFDTCFDQFFTFKDISGESSTSSESDNNEEGEGDSESQGEGGSAGGERQNQQASGKKSKSKSKSKNLSLLEEEEEEDLGPGEMTDPKSDLGKLLLNNSVVELTTKMAAAGEAVDVREIQVFTQKGLYTRRIMDEMGLTELNYEIGDLRQAPTVPGRRLGQELRKRRDWLREQVRDYVEKQFLLNADVSGKRLREELLRKIKLSNVEHRNFRMIQEIVYKMAKRLATMHSRRKKVFKRGMLNVPRTIRNNKTR